ncbi:MAG TPA: lectin-like protein [bacterium]|nr:lectin-like protein [bacterium]
MNIRMNIVFGVCATLMLWNTAHAQCDQCSAQNPSAVQEMDVATAPGVWTTVLTDMAAGEYALFKVEKGRYYEWSTCGGAEVWDTLLSLRVTASCTAGQLGGSPVSHNDNDPACTDGEMSTIGWRAYMNTTVAVLLSQASDCTAPSAANMTLKWRYSLPESCINCTSHHPMQLQQNPEFKGQGPTGWTVVSAAMSGGDWTQFELLGGTYYEWTTCGDDAFDTQLSLYNGECGSDELLSFNNDDSACTPATGSTISYFAFDDQTVTLLLSKNYCSDTTADDMTLQWHQITPVLGCEAYTNNLGTIPETTSDTFVTVSSGMSAGEFFYFEVVKGSTYEWTTCGDNDFDTQLTLRGEEGDLTPDVVSPLLAYNDNGGYGGASCGNGSTIRWTANFSGNVWLLLNEYLCKTNGSNDMTLRWRRLSTDRFTEEHYLAAAINPAGVLIIKDNLTNLWWRKSIGDPILWGDALNECSTATWGGFTDWRLPDINELGSIINYAKDEPATFLPAVKTDNSAITDQRVWSSTTVNSIGDNGLYAWTILLGDGRTYINPKAYDPDSSTDPDWTDASVPSSVACVRDDVIGVHDLNHRTTASAAEITGWTCDRSHPGQLNRVEIDFYAVSDRGLPTQAEHLIVTKNYGLTDQPSAAANDPTYCNDTDNHGFSYDVLADADIRKAIFDYLTVNPTRPQPIKVYVYGINVGNEAQRTLLFSSPKDIYLWDICGDGVLDPDLNPALRNENCENDPPNIITETCGCGVSSCTVCDASCFFANGATRYCGDGKKDTDCSEVCDDGNNVTETCGWTFDYVACDGCNSTCTVDSGTAQWCGDGITQAGYETCDDGRNGGNASPGTLGSSATDGCFDNCTKWNPTGTLDVASYTSIAGWGCDKDTPAQNATIHLYFYKKNQTTVIPMSGNAWKDIGPTSVASDGAVQVECGQLATDSATHRFDYNLSLDATTVNVLKTAAMADQQGTRPFYVKAYPLNIPTAPPGDNPGTNMLPFGGSCGDGTQQTEWGEDCDDGNIANCDGCSSNCTASGSSFCGDGCQSPDEECDPGSADMGYNKACLLNVPGDTTHKYDCQNNPCDIANGWYFHGGNCYKYFSSTVNFDAAQASCVTNGSALASIASAEENSFVNQISSATSWFGLRDTNCTSPSCTHSISLYDTGCDGWDYPFEGTNELYVYLNGSQILGPINITDEDCGGDTWNFDAKTGDTIGLVYQEYDTYPEENYWNLYSTYATIVSNYFPSTSGYSWSGRASCGAPTRGWTWKDGSTYSYNNWNGGEPNNSPDGYCGTQPCGYIYKTTESWNGKWDDIACTATMPYVCEKQGYCGDGVPGTYTYLTTTTYNFDSGTIPSDANISYVNGATGGYNYGWEVSTTYSSSPSYSIRTTNYQQSSKNAGIKFTGNSNGQICYDRYGYSEDCVCDELKISIDGVLKETLHGNQATWTNKCWTVTAGSHTIEFLYTKDSSVDTDIDRWYVDNLVFVKDQSVSVTETCDGDTKSCVTLTGSADATGNAPCKADCSGYNATACAKTYTCNDTRPANSSWNTASSYTQSWTGSAWTPVDDPTTDHNTTVSTTDCRFKCNTNYNWVSPNCVAATQTANCPAKPATGTMWNDVGKNGTYTQTWNGSAWAPVNTTTYNTTAGDCRYTCAANYTWNGSVCVADTHVNQACTGKPANSAYNTATSITQTWDGDSWEPSTVATHNTVASTTECRFACNFNYNWSSPNCAPATQSATCPAKPAGTIWNDGGKNGTYTQTWDGSAFMPVLTTQFNATAGDCNFTCPTNYTWNTGTSTCDAATQSQACTGKDANSTYNTATTITQTWNGSAWTPSEVATHNDAPSTTECRYTCNSGYPWDGAACNPCQTGWSYYPGTTHCYKYFTGPLNFDAAKTDCVDNQKGNLVNIESLAENNWVRDSIGVPTQGQYWLGYNAANAVGPGTGSANGNNCGSSASYAINNGGGTYSFDTSSASATGCLCDGSTVTGNYVVFKFAPNLTGRWEIAVNSTGNANVSIYTSCNCGSKLDCANNTTSGWENLNSYNFTSGTTYYIMIAGLTDLTGTMYVRPPITAANYASQYTWTDGNNHAYRNWGASQPDYSNGNERCTQVWGLTADSTWGTWNDNQCSTTMSYVCERGTPGCGNGIIEGGELCETGKSGTTYGSNSITCKVWGATNYPAYTVHANRNVACTADCVSATNVSTSIGSVNGFGYTGTCDFCGDNVVNGNVGDEVCDGGTPACTTFGGAYASGAASCLTNCSAWDRSLCVCASGYTKSGNDCVDVNECTTTNPCNDNGDNSSVCTNSTGSYSCACSSGFSYNGVSCINIDECVVNTNPCDNNSDASATCTDTIGSYNCTCSTGFSFTSGSCYNINECAGGHDCSVNASCADSTPGYTCTCNNYYRGTGTVQYGTGDTCAYCNTSAYCGSNCTACGGATPNCEDNTTTTQCVECTGNNSTTGNAQCVALYGSTVGTSKMKCKPATDACVQCLVDADCGAGNSCTASNTCIMNPCQTGWSYNSTTSHCYKYFDTTTPAPYNVLKTFDDAQTACQAMSGNLVSVGDSNEKDFLINTIYNGNAWIGLSDTCTDGIGAVGSGSSGGSYGSGVCPTAVSIDPDGGTYTGSTASLSTSYYTGDSGSGPEHVFTFVPSWTGTWVIAVNYSGTSWDRVIYVRDSACSTQLAYNDAGSSSIDSVSIALTRGTTYRIFVDGYSGAKGAYTLTVTASGAPAYARSWNWKDSSSVTYTNWNSGEPNNSPNGYCASEPCASMLAGGAWNDATCTATQAYICERGTPSCGNGIKEGTEACDLGANNGACSTCTTSCTIKAANVCGDGLTCAADGEQCDDADADNCDNCSNTCKNRVINTCGDGDICGEACDDGNLNNNDACKNNCTPNTCGDGIRSYIVGTDWTNPANWTTVDGSTGSTLTWDAANNALKAVGYKNIYLTTKIPIDTTKNYYIKYDVMTKNNAGKTMYAGTHSYDSGGTMLPGHPGSYDYFGEVGTTFTADTWYTDRVNAVIAGAARTGESSDTGVYAAWHTGTKSATIMFLLNYSDVSAQETYIRNLRFYEGSEKMVLHLDETSGTTATDSSGSGITGTLTNGPAWTSGKIGNALRFDGIDDYVLTTLKAQVGNLDAVAGNPWTVSLWFKQTNTTGTIYQALANLSTTATGGTFALNVYNNRVYVAVKGGTNTQIKTSVANNAWHHVVVTWDGVGPSALAYADNGAAVTIPVGTTAVQDKFLTIGAANNGALNRFLGWIDEVKVYNRALTVTEISALYNQTGDNSYEMCDDGNGTASDGCTSCNIDTSWNCSGDAPSSCYRCGNSVVDPGEVCDPTTTTETCTNLGIAGTTTSATCKADCSGWQTTGQCSKTYTCAAKPQTVETIYSNVASYLQTWNGAAWNNVDDATTDYNATGSNTACRYRCATDYARVGSTCTNAKTYACTGLPTGAVWYNNTASYSYNQTYTTAGGWSPADDTTVTYNETPVINTCDYKCAAGYTWTGSACLSCPGTTTLATWDSADEWTTSGEDNWSRQTSGGQSGGWEKWNYLTRRYSYSQTITSGTLANLTGCATATVKFYWYLDDYGGSGEYMSFDCSGDGTTWTNDVWTKADANSDSTTSWTQATATLPAACRGATPKVRFRFTGADTWNIDYWGIDTVTLN